MAQEQAAGRAKAIEVLRKVTDAMVSSWNVSPLVQQLYRIKGMETLASQLETHRAAAVPILREIAENLTAIIDTWQDGAYNDTTEPEAPKKGKKA